MVRYRKVRKGTTPPGVGSSGMNEKENKKEKSIGQKQGGTVSKGVAAAHWPFRRSVRHHSETTFSSTGDTSADEVESRIVPHSSRGPRNQWLPKMSIILSRLHHFASVLFAPWLFQFRPHCSYREIYFYRGIYFYFCWNDDASWI